MEQVVKVKIRKPHGAEQERFVRSTAKRQINKSGRRWGKTVGAGIKGLEAFCGICCACGGTGCSWCDSGKVEPKRVLYAAPTAEQVGKFWYEVTLALDEAIVGGYLKKDETEKFIERPGTEVRIKAKTAWNANTLRGDFADLLILEEFQLMNEDTWDEVGQPMLLDNNGTAVFIYTPPSLKSEGVSKARDPRHATKLFRKAELDDRWETFHFTSYQNPTLSRDALGEIEKDMSFDAYRREILAEDDEVESSWLVYGKFNEGQCKIKRFEIPETWSVITGHDFGKANPAALFAARVQYPLPEGAPNYLRYGDYIIFKEYAPGGGYSAAQHIDKFKELTTRYRVEMSLGGNITTEGEIRQAYAPHGWVISEPFITQVSAQIDRVYGLMELSKLFVFEDNYGLLGELANCMWKLDTDNKPTNVIQGESKYHFLACLRYLCTCIPLDRSPMSREIEKIKVKVW